jgi:hypothetical protein
VILHPARDGRPTGLKGPLNNAYVLLARPGMYPRLSRQFVRKNRLDGCDWKTCRSRFDGDEREPFTVGRKKQDLPTPHAFGHRFRRHLSEELQTPKNASALGGFEQRLPLFF